jgi:hypothetical protein
MKKKPPKKRPQRKRKRAKASASQKRAKGRGTRELEALKTPRARGLGSESAGQSGDLPGLSRAESADSESVAELVEEGQPFEASVVDSVENAPDPDEREIRTSETPEDDVPEEYRDEREGR